MKQLLIVNSQKAINAKADNSGANVTPYDLSNLAEGAITFFELDGSTPLAAAPTKNFGIALGRGSNKPAFVIPEVDLDTLEVVKAMPKASKEFKVVFTMPTPVVGKEYTVIFVKKGTVPHERNMWSTSFVAKTTTAATEATSLAKAINDKVNDLFDVVATVSGAVVTVTSNTDWEVKLADGLMDVAFTTKQYAEKAIGDKAFIADLAQRCAADKGFNYLDGDGKDIYPGYPEAVEDLVPNTSGTGGVSTAGYVLFNLHFATGRKSGKQTDERVWQYVHIAVPLTSPAYSTIDTILSGAKNNDQAEADA